MKYYVSTPIYYVNAKPHLGHAYTTIVNDVLTRFHRLLGYDSYLLTGTDEHGDKIVRAAEREGRNPQQYADEISALFKAAWPKLNIETNDFIRTTEERHKKVVSAFMELVYKRGDIYFGEYGGHYCFGCERFYTEKELQDGLCPDHQTKPEYISEKNYFFRMSNYQDWLIDYIKANPTFIRPERYKNEVLGFLRDPLEDLCITRPKSRLTWGIDVPFDEGFVTYVWFDALINYISALGWPDGELYQKYWPVAQHTIAKDILKPHAIFWPTMLQSAGLPLYKHLNVHGYWQIGFSKMSKSIGNVVEALAMADRYGNDPFRYFLMREMNFGLDSEFSEDRLVDRYNSDLANDLGNLWQRALAMLQKFSHSQVPILALKGLGQSDDAEWARRFENLVTEYSKHFEEVNPRAALTAVWEFVGLLNKTIDSEAPWALAKDPSKAERLSTVMARLVKGLALLGALVWPVMPATGAEMWRRLGLDPAQITIDNDRILTMLSHGREIKAGSAFFPRIETTETKTRGKNQADKTKTDAESAEGTKTKALACCTEAAGLDEAPKDGVQTIETITIDDFKRLELRVGKVLAAEALPKSLKLIKLTVSLGDSERTVVAGIGRHYQPEDLVGRFIVVIANLAPAKLMGVESKGMVLCATQRDSDGGERLTLLTVASEIAPGSKIS
ncbi:MAG: methionine--tRNA ligase [Deltaproteobacteria bacterium]|jgi:methionyl-tRNA synthetase|nr:methionine--tRNA ligase [Deltaproteobacteria bacterium]